MGGDADDMAAAIGLLAKSAAHAAHDRSSKCLSPKLTVSPPNDNCSFRVPTARDGEWSIAYS